MDEPRRGRFQFSIRTLLLMTLVAAVLMVPVVWVVRERKQMVQAISTVSFQREGDWVLATFLDGTICIHDKREIEPVCQKSVKGPEL